MSQPKPNTMDDCIDELLEELHWLPIQDRYEELHPIYPGDSGLNDSHVQEAKAALQSLMDKRIKEAVVAARIDELEALNSSKKLIGNAIEDRLASLKGGDDE